MTLNVLQVLTQNVVGKMYCNTIPLNWAGQPNSFVSRIRTGKCVEVILAKWRVSKPAK